MFKNLRPTNYWILSPEIPRSFFRVKGAMHICMWVHTSMNINRPEVALAYPALSASKEDAGMFSVFSEC